MTKQFNFNHCSQNKINFFSIGLKKGRLEFLKFKKINFSEVMDQFDENHAELGEAKQLMDWDVFSDWQKYIVYLKIV